MDTQAITRWRDFLDRDPTTFTRDEFVDFMVDAVDPDWRGGPVEALVPGVVEEFRAISKRLARLYREDRKKWEKALAATRPLFKVGCAFGDALERLGIATTEEDRRAAHAEARGVYAVLVMYAEDEE